MRAEAAPQGPFMGEINLPYYQEKASSGIERLDLERIYPPAFTMFLSVLFLVPVWILLSIGTMQGVSYFISNAFWIVLAIPVGIVFAYLAMNWQLAREKWIVGFMLIVPGVLLLWISESMYVGAVDKSVKLNSADCSSFPEKRQLQISWEAAHDLYSSCIDATSAREGYSREELMANFRIQDCEEYTTALTGYTPEGMRTNAKSYQQDWTYLRHLEETHMCSGWCYEGIQLWATTPHKDSCSSAVSTLFTALVAQRASQVAVVMLASLGTFVMLLILLGPMLRRCTGGKW
mmetsp:Transcript_27848/g.58952  ORF Transcript_27848/g.58952 Transcript_27848/m.58952 type:complete len:290 (-) Transcript_27848:86-955(-)